MKVLARILAPLVVLIAAAAVAVAAPLPPTTPYPPVPADPGACKVEKLEVEKAQLVYDQRVRDYQRILEAFRRGAASPAEVRAAERAVHEAAIALNNAKYAEAACRNDNGDGPDEECVDLSLELNRLIDELALRKELERLAKENYDILMSVPASPAEREHAWLAWQQARIEREQVEQRIADLKEKIAENADCADFPSTRPTTPPTTPSSTTPSSTTPSTTPPGSTAPSTTPPAGTTGPTRPTTIVPSTGGPTMTLEPSSVTRLPIG